MECAVNTRTLDWVIEALSAAGHDVEVGGGVDRARTWSGAAIDSRAECSGRLFFALAGENADGHAFAAAALGAGCAAAVISDVDVARSLDGEAWLRVEEVAGALRDLARSYRRTLDARVVAITGSAGKTTTKEYLRAILRRRYRVHSNPGNYNSTIGVPLTVLDAEPDCEYLVSEVGANQAGEIAMLEALLAPDVGVITNIGDAHIGLFGSRDAIASEKGRLLEGLSAGHAVIPAGTEYSEYLVGRAPGRVVTFASAPPADFVVGEVRPTDALGIEFEINDQRFSLASPGAYNALNAAAAAAAADVCGIGLPLASKALAEVMPLPGRGRVHRAGGVLLVDESYNASPSSMALSLSMLGAAPGNRVAVLGDMAELGDHAGEEHRRIGRHLAGLDIDEVVWVGRQADLVREAIADAGGECRFTSFEDVSALIGARPAIPAAGDVVLVKASRACGLDRFVSSAIARLRNG